MKTFYLKKNIFFITRLDGTSNSVCPFLQASPYDEVYGIKNVTMEIKPGQLVAIVGPVGCGKSSLLMTLLKELPVSSGSLSVGGR